MTPGLITLVYDKPRLEIPRHYLTGFVGSEGDTSMHFDGNVLKWNYALVYDLSFPVRSNVYAASTNVYSMDYIFDEYNCEVSIFGSPISGAVYVKWRPMPNAAEWRIQVHASLLLDVTIKADLPPVSSPF